MCLAIPGRIISFEADESGSKMAKADFAGIIKKVCIDFLPDVQIGDYVLVHVGFALNKIDETEAQETLNALREVGRAWQEAEQASRSEEGNKA